MRRAKVTRSQHRRRRTRAFDLDLRTPSGRRLPY
ncbi:hypothetical protein FHS44_003371 [Streptosporangium saharense]|uniref:Uncharacterized protein n=1 Tax=Streptosporangium saharense TaxID=1706840 RepID=A0A7W7QMN6_9ACTN|nr:hypothetical protein [Streptosporangium saharense]